MAKELTHILTAQNVFKQLKGSGQQRLSQIIDANIGAFYLGAFIPDAFFYDVIPFRKISGHNVHISRALHSKKRAQNDQKAVSFFDAIAANPHAWRLKVAFAAGIVTHTVGDRIIHEVIDHYTKSWGQKGGLALASHRQFETLIDMVLLERLHVHPRDLRLERLVDVDQHTEDCLFRFYLAHLLGDDRAVCPCLLNSLKKALTQQRLFLKLFAVKRLYYIMNLANMLVAGRLRVWSNLFYPDTVGIPSFPILDRLDLTALTNGRSFTGPLIRLIDAITTDALFHIRVGLYRLT